MVVSQHPPRNSFVAAMRKLYNPIGFTHGYNFVLWFIFSGAMLGFCLARLMYLDFYGIFCPANQANAHASPGECYWYTARAVYRIGIQLHLYCIIPAGGLAVFQFVPYIRHKVILLHRINGYIAITLALFGVTGAIMIAPVAFGGDLAIQSSVGVLAIMFIGSLSLAYYYIKRLRIGQHRAWMLRAWFYAGCIITVRLILATASAIITGSGQKTYRTAKLCRELASYYPADALTKVYPACSDLDAWVLISTQGEGLFSLIAALNVTFGTATWMSIAIHAIGVEFYLQLTPKETERLRRISVQRQIAAGIKAAPDSGIESDFIGAGEHSISTGNIGASTVHEVKHQRAASSASSSQDCFSAQVIA